MHQLYDKQSVSKIRTGRSRKFRRTDRRGRKVDINTTFENLNIGIDLQRRILQMEGGTGGRELK